MRMLPIDGLSGYWISIDGTVFSSKRRVSLGRNGTKIFFDGKLKPLKTQVDRQGYFYVRLSHAGRSRNRFVHHLLLETFKSKRPEGMEARHINGIKTDISLENLAWGTPQENADDKIRHGTVVRGDRQWKAKLNQDSIEFIRSHRGIIKGRTLAAQFGVSPQTICGIQKFRTWVG